MEETKISKKQDARARRDYFEELPKDKQTSATKQEMKTIPTKAIIAKVKENKKNYKKYKITKQWKHIIISEFFWFFMVFVGFVMTASTFALGWETFLVAFVLVCQGFCTIMDCIGYRKKEYMNSDNSIQVPNSFLWYL